MTLHFYRGGRFLATAGFLCLLGSLALAGPGRPRVRQQITRIPAPRPNTFRAPRINPYHNTFPRPYAPPRGSFVLPRSVPVQPFRSNLPNARQLLRQMLQAENNLSLTGTQTTTAVNNGMDFSSVQRVTRNGSHAVRREYLRPPLFNGALDIDNGRLEWFYLPSRKTLEISASRLSLQKQSVPDIMGRLQRRELVAQYVGNETVAGHDCGVVQVYGSDQSGPVRYRAWIDFVMGAQLKIEHYDQSGRLISSSYFTDVTYNPPPNRGEFAEPRTPRDVSVISKEYGVSLPSVGQAQAEAGFPLAQPAYLPGGYRFQSAQVEDYQGQKLVHLHYSNGLTTLSLSETPWRGSHPDQIKRLRPGVWQRWRGGVWILAVGNLADGELQSVLNSLR